MADGRNAILRPDQKIAKLNKSSGTTCQHISDQYISRLGTNRLSEKKAKIGKSIPWHEMERDYINGL